MEIDINEYRQLQDHARDIAGTLPEAIGLAAVKLDCGCVRFCGVSFTGDPVGRMTRLAPQDERGAGAICLKCRRPEDRMMQRIKDRLMVWPGRQDEWPEPELRKIIAHKVFGEDYRETVA